MSFIIGTKCVSECDTGCVDACPVDCIHGPIDISGAGAEVEGFRAEGKLEGLQCQDLKKDLEVVYKK